MNVNSYLVHLVVVVAVFMTPSVALADWIQFYEHEKEEGRSWRLNLPPPGDNYVARNNYSVGSVRRIGSQIQTAHGGIFYRNVSSVRIWADDTGVTLYLFDGDDFTGNMVRWHVSQGFTGLIYDLGWFNNRLASFIAVREKVGEDLIEMATDTPISLDELVDEVRSSFMALAEGDNRIKSAHLHDTQVNYTTAYSMWPEVGVDTSQWDTLSILGTKYRDTLRIYQEIELDVKWWPFKNYDAWVKLSYFFRVDGNQHLAFTPHGPWAVWVEGGALRRQLFDALSSTVSGSLTDSAEEIRDRIRIGIEQQAGSNFAPLIWNGVEKVGWKIPCDNFSEASGFSKPADPFCWQPGSRKEMFPPTLILHHDSSSP